MVEALQVSEDYIENTESESTNKEFHFCLSNQVTDL